MNILYVNSLEANNKELRQQLAEAQVFEALWTGACEVAKNDPVQAIYRLREQVKGLEASLDLARHERNNLLETVAKQDAEIAELRNELETERMRNVACGVVAMADTPDAAKQARDMSPDYMSAACQDVARRVDECIKLREQVALLRDELNTIYKLVPDLVPVMHPSALAATEH